MKNHSINRVVLNYEMVDRAQGFLYIKIYVH